MLSGIIDGPSRTLLRVIGEKTSAPDGWKGYRALTEK